MADQQPVPEPVIVPQGAETVPPDDAVVVPPDDAVVVPPDDAVVVPPDDAVVVSPDDAVVVSPDDQGIEGVVASPAKVLRIGSMVKQLLEEVRHAPLDEAGRTRLREIHETSVRELAEGLSDDLREELSGFSLPFTSDAPSEPELRIAQAQLVGWLEGLFHGIQATLFAQQMAARAQLDQLGRRPLPPGSEPGPGGPDPHAPGTYL